MDAFLVRKGGKSTPKQLYFIKNGQYENGLTGFNIGTNHVSFTSSVSYGDGYIALNNGAWFNGESGSKYSTLQKFDLTRYKRACFEVEYSNIPGDVYSCCGVSDVIGFAWSITEGWLKSVSIQGDTVRRKYAVDIEALTGEHSLALQEIGQEAGAGNTLRVYNMWLER